MTYHLAIDIGASSGRHILGHIENGKLCLEEVHRFENYIKEQNSALTWDIEHLVNEVIEGIAKCGKIGKIPETVAIDTWGVDYLLLDEDKKEILPAVAYRDSRTSAVLAEIDNIYTQEELYQRTGIQKQNFNTIYQLYCDKKSGKLDNAKYFLMMPDYIGSCLTGVIHNEYTNATTTGLINVKTRTWDTEILDKLGIKRNIFQNLSLPCTEVGKLSSEIAEKVGFNCKVLHAPSHDTASAFAACPIKDDSMCISSGTWSLIGTENKNPVLSEAALNANFTNEGGIEYRYRFLKNIMGMWLFQNVRKNLDKKYTYDEMMQLAMQSESFEEIDTNASCFVAPDNMITAIRTYLKNENLPIDVVINTIYHSLAKSYAKAVKEMEKISGKVINTVSIVGGGSKDSYLNKLTAKYTGKKVTAGPVEATAIGNILSQIIYADKSISLEKARDIVKKSFNITEFV